MKISLYLSLKDNYSSALAKKTSLCTEVWKLDHLIWGTWSARIKPRLRSSLKSSEKKELVLKISLYLTLKDNYSSALTKETLCTESQTTWSGAYQFVPYQTVS